MSANDLAHRGSAADWFSRQQRDLNDLQALACCPRCIGEGVLMVSDGDGAETAHEEQCSCWWGWLLHPIATTPAPSPGGEEPF